MSTYDFEALKKELIRDEGKRLKPYRDSLGNWTVGVGHLLTGNELMRFVDPATGTIRNTLTEDHCAVMLEDDILKAQVNLSRLVADWRELDDVRQRALLNLSFNLGDRLGTFVGFLRCVDDRQWLEAGKHLKNSRWWRQVKSRGPRIRNMIETGMAWEGE